MIDAGFAYFSFFPSFRSFSVNIFVSLPLGSRSANKTWLNDAPPTWRTLLASWYGRFTEGELTVYLARTNWMMMAECFQ